MCLPLLINSRYLFAHFLITFLAFLTFISLVSLFCCCCFSVRLLIGSLSSGLVTANQTIKLCQDLGVTVLTGGQLRSD